MTQPDDPRTTRKFTDTEIEVVRHWMAMRRIDDYINDPEIEIEASAGLLDDLNAAGMLNEGTGR